MQHSELCKYALLHKHMSQRGSNETELHMGTSKSAEGDGLSELFGCTLAEGMHISTHVRTLIILVY